MKDKLKNWWFGVGGLILVLLDQGFGFFKPIFEEIGISSTAMGWLRFAFAVYAVLKLQQQKPNDYPEKVQKVLNKIGLPKPRP